MATAATYKKLSDILTTNDRYDINKITYFTMTEDETLVIPDTNVIDVYRRYVSPYIQVYKVTEKQREFYRYRPYLLSADIYGTPRLGWLIMMLNDRECASKFTIKSTIKLIPMNLFGQLYDNLVVKSTSKLEANWAKYLTKVE